MPFDKERPIPGTDLSFIIYRLYRTSSWAFIYETSKGQGYDHGVVYNPAEPMRLYELNCPLRDPESRKRRLPCQKCKKVKRSIPRSEFEILFSLTLKLL